MKKFLIAFLAVLCFACLAAAACTNKNYYILTFVTEEGVTVECEAQSGAQVKAGHEVSFTLIIDDNAIGDPLVTVNDKVLNADNNGVYSFKITQDTKVEVTGVSLLGNYTVDFKVEQNFEYTDENGETLIGTENVDHEWVKFYTVDDEPIQELKAASGESISFKIKVSVYFEDYDYTVTAGAAILRPDGDGVYTYSVTDTQTIVVKGFPNAEEIIGDTFYGRNELGTQQYPYTIRKPIDLYYWAKLLGGEYIQSVVEGYFVLENDIDMKGEQLYVIGDLPDERSNSVFCGTFDGRNHTISNYYQTDTYLQYSNTEDPYPVNLQYVGLFGYVQASSSGSAGIYNLNLDNFTITVNGASTGKQIFVGGIVGSGIGVNISNCTARGTIIADGDYGYFGYTGGIIGFQQSAFANNNTRFYSIVQSCSSDVTINCDSGYMYSAGGITGYLLSYEERTAASILNCYATGNVSGAMRSGGIAGQVSPYSSIKNCYATGTVTARSTVQITDSGDFHLAYAGGIAGNAQYESIISDCFFTGTTNVRASAGNAYAFTDGISAGKANAGTDYIHTGETVIYNCYTTGNTLYGESVSAISDSFIKETLGWATEDWAFSGNGLPTINKEEASKTFTVTVMINGNTAASLKVTDAYIPVSYWYYDAEGTESANKLPEFIGTGVRTYGYYFDEDCKIKVPFGYIPTDDLTIYAKYVNYSDVVGEYYIIGEDGKKFELTDDGYIIYRDGAVSSVSTYVYNGEYLILQNTFFAIIESDENDFYTFKAELKNGVLEIYAYEHYLANDPLTAVQKLNNFVYGTYYDENGVQYTFSEDGTGIWKTSLSEDNITFTVSGNTITVWRNGTDYTGRLQNGMVVELNGGELSVYDMFKGVWEKSAGSNRQYSFDGIDSWSYVYYGYNADGQEVELDTANGSYVNNGDNTITLYDSGNTPVATVVYEEGLLKIDGETYYCENSFVGTWTYLSSRPIEITLNGITDEGYGTGTIYYFGVYGETYDITYQAVQLNGTTYIAAYNYYELYALLSYDTKTKALTGEVYDVNDLAMKSAVFCLYDDLKGAWSGTGSKGSSLKLDFNGLGNYNMPGVGSMAVRGRVTVNGSDIYYGLYLNNGTLEGSFELNGKTYELKYDEAEKTLSVVCGEENFTLERE